MHGVIKAINLKQTQVKVILADLIAQGIIVEINEKSSKKYEYKFGAPQLNTKQFEDLRNAKINEFNEMLKYIETVNCRMKFLCNFLGDIRENDCDVCDNDKQKIIKISTSTEWIDKLEDFRRIYFPILAVENKTTNLINGVAGSYYRISNVDQALL